VTKIVNKVGTLFAFPSLAVSSAFMRAVAAALC